MRAVQGQCLDLAHQDKPLEALEESFIRIAKDLMRQLNTIFWIA
jgi:hypothetical protein